MEELKPCPFCGSAARIKPGSQIPPTIEEFVAQEPNAQCSNGQCGARYIIMSVTEWNGRTDDSAYQSLKRDAEALRKLQEIASHTIVVIGKPVGNQSQKMWLAVEADVRGVGEDYTAPSLTEAIDNVKE